MNREREFNFIIKKIADLKAEYIKILDVSEYDISSEHMREAEFELLSTDFINYLGDELNSIPQNDYLPVEIDNWIKDLQREKQIEEVSKSLTELKQEQIQKLIYKLTEIKLWVLENEFSQMIQSANEKRSICSQELLLLLLLMNRKKAFGDTSNTKKTISGIATLTGLPERKIFQFMEKFRTNPTDVSSNPVQYENIERFIKELFDEFLTFSSELNG